MKQINRLKIVFAEQNKTVKWLADTLGKNKATVSRWCINESLPLLETLVKIANSLKVDVKYLHVLQ